MKNQISIIGGVFVILTCVLYLTYCAFGLNANLKTIVK